MILDRRLPTAVTRSKIIKPGRRKQPCMTGASFTAPDPGIVKPDQDGGGLDEPTRHVLAGLFAGAIQAASPDATLTECLRAAFAAAEVAMTRSSGLRPPSACWWCGAGSPVLWVSAAHGRCSVA
jgi:hypothetical protein